MPSANYVLLEKITVGAAGASSVTFSGIPQTGYTDLVVKVSARTTNYYLTVKFNGSTTGYSKRLIQGSGSTVGSFTGDSTTSYTQLLLSENNGSTANTFNSAEIYFPNYTSSNNKSYSIDTTQENNSATSYMEMVAGLWSNTAAITSIELAAEGGGSPLILANSTFYLYGVAKLGTTPAIVPYATGGDTIMTDGTYWYHAFRSSGTFTPAKGLSCDVLVVAGGGGANGGASYAGGGAGGLLAHTAQSLLSATNYTVTIGAGGAGINNGASTASNGSNSQFASLTASVGGGGGGGGWTGSGDGPAALSGGSGGGGGATFTAGGGTTTKVGGAGTSGQGFAGGNGSPVTGTASQLAGGGGGGAGAVGAAGSSGGAGGNGGAGVNTYSTWLNATGTGVSGFIAGGGAGWGQTADATGGSGNGGGSNGSNPTRPTANTGGGGNASNATAGTAGASGLVIVRYAV